MITSGYAPEPPLNAYSLPPITFFSFARLSVSAAMLALVLSGCGRAGYSGSAESAAGALQAGVSTGQASPSKQQELLPDASGLWQGTSTAYCRPTTPFSFNTRCNAINNIQLTFIQNGSKISGFYKCSVGNQDCRDQNESGKIGPGDVKPGGRVSFRLLLVDGSSCIFNGVLTAPNALAGNYTCYQGGGLVEQGRFAVSRSY
jgi:hypothetical protein